MTAVDDITSLRQRREAIVNQHADAENRHDVEATIGTFHHPRYEFNGQSDSRLDVVPVFRLGVLTDDCLAALAKAGDVVDRCHFGPLRCLDDHVN